MYLDPGSGSFIIQMAIAGVVGVLFVARTQIARFFGLFRRKEKSTLEDKSKNAG